MGSRSHSRSRRSFLSQAGLVPLFGAPAFGASPVAAAQAASGNGLYERLGVRPFINAAGTYTALSASLLPPEVRAAMDEASRQHVSIPELQEAAGKHIASLPAATTPRRSGASPTRRA